MKAKDTVIIPEGHSESIWCPHCGEEFGIEDKVLIEREVQAGISFKAGIKEVVDWVDEMKAEEHYTDFEHYQRTSILLDKEAWQAKLKECWSL